MQTSAGLKRPMSKPASTLGSANSTSTESRSIRLDADAIEEIRQADGGHRHWSCRTHGPLGLCARPLGERLIGGRHERVALRQMQRGC